MTSLKHARYSTHNALEQFIMLKEEGFNFVGFIPNFETLDNKFIHHQHKWFFHMLSKFIAYFSGNYNFFIVQLKNTDVQTEILNNNIYLYDNPQKIKEFIFKQQNHKIAFIKINGMTENYCTIDPILFKHILQPYWFTVNLSHLPNFVKQQINSSFQNIMDMRNTPPHVSLNGFSGAEDWGRWTDGNRATITMALPNFLHGKPLRIELPLVQVFGEQRVRASLNGRSLPELRLDKPETITFLATEAETATGSITLAFDLPDAKSPASLGQPGDTRMLGIGLKDLIVEQMPEGQRQ